MRTLGAKDINHSRIAHSSDGPHGRSGWMSVVIAFSFAFGDQRSGVVPPAGDRNTFRIPVREVSDRLDVRRKGKGGHEMPMVIEGGRVGVALQRPTGDHLPNSLKPNWLESIKRVTEMMVRDRAKRHEPAVRRQRALESSREDSIRVRHPKVCSQPLANQQLRTTLSTERGDAGWPRRSPKKNSTSCASAIHSPTCRRGSRQATHDSLSFPQTSSTKRSGTPSPTTLRLPPAAPPPESNRQSGSAPSFAGWRE